MQQFTDNPMAHELEFVATLAGRTVEASVQELRSQDQLTISIRRLLRGGADINDVSEAVGIPVAEIRKRIDSPLKVESELPDLAGIR